MSERQIDLFEDPNAIDQIKLSSLTVYNWGSFNGLHTIDINPDGTLITGENGAGKSTIIDGLMVLLSPAGRVSFNMAAAQGDKTDRSLISYMRGSYGRYEDENGATEKNLRNNSVATVIKAKYTHTASDRIAVLLAVFYINSNSNQLSDVKKIYVVSESDISVKEMLKNFTNNDAHMLKVYLKSINRCLVCDDNFKEYETHFRSLLRMENSNAPALLSRALGLKKIDDLTNLIRKLVLEPGEIRKDAVETVKQFEDLKTTHQKLLDAREQEAALLPVRENFEKRQENFKAEEIYHEANDKLIHFAAEYAVDFYEHQLKLRNSELEQAQLQNDEMEKKRTELEEYQNLCHENYLKQGGDIIEKVAFKISSTEADVRRVRENLERYNILARKLSLKDGSCEDNFLDNFQKHSQLLEAQDKMESELFEKRAKIVSDSKNIQGKLKEIGEQVDQLQKRPDSNIDFRYQRLRDEIVEDLDIDPNELVYAAELMDVEEEEQRWQGAIERALGGIRQTLLVSEHFYRGITAWVNQRHTGLHVRIQVVEPNSHYQIQFGNRGFLKKLRWKHHPFTNWLQNNLLKQDLACVDSVDEMNEIEFSMTVEGLIHRRGGFFEKKDLKSINDRHEWCLGFSSKDKLLLLQREQDHLSNQFIELQAQDIKLVQKKKEYEEKHTSIVLLNEFKQFSQIDVKSLEYVLEDLKEQQKLVTTSPDTQKFREIWEQSKKSVQEIITKIIDLGAKIASIKTAINECTVQLEKNRDKVLPEGISQEIRDLIINVLNGAKINVAACYEREIQDEAENAFRKLLQDFSNKDREYREKLIAAMNKFSSKWGEEKAYENLVPNLQYVAGYIDLLNKIQKEGLPALVEEFKEKLNTEVTQSVASIKSKIDQELSMIEQRISMINAVLSRAEFRENTYLKIVAKKVKYPFIIEFEKDVSKVLGMILSEDHEKRFEALSKVVDTLDTAVRNSNTKDNMRLLDPRLRMFFVAQELDRHTNEIKDVLDSSSGKSGGEKEAFAGSVVAAALAYVLTPEDESVPAYSSVFLDEAFSNTSDSVSLRVLRIFKELKLHVNLITPFKNIDIARDYARSLIIMTRDINNHNSRANELTWEEYDRQLNDARQQELTNLGITVESVDK